MFPLPGLTRGLTVAARRIPRRTRRATRLSPPFARAHCVPPRRRPNLDTKWWVENGSSKGLRASCIQFAASIAIASGVQ
jgi:hypothetical protein